MNSHQLTTIAGALTWGIHSLGASKEHHLEAEILLAHVLQTPRSHLHAWPEETLALPQQVQFQQAIDRRQHGEPIAYITGHREFWSLDLAVTAQTLIPRHETELLVELTLQHVPNEKGLKVAELGTGSGAIALALAVERPNWEVHAVEYSAPALQIAQHNAERLNIHNIIWHAGHWCQALPAEVRFAAIVSNPPYLAEHDPHLQAGDLRFEPLSALVSGPDGLTALQEIIQTAPTHLAPGGYVFLEHGHTQAAAIIKLLQDAGYKEIKSYKDLAGLYRVIGAQF